MVGDESRDSGEVWSVMIWAVARFLLKNYDCQIPVDPIWAVAKITFSCGKLLYNFDKLLCGQMRFDQLQLLLCECTCKYEVYTISLKTFSLVISMQL